MCGQVGWPGLNAVDEQRDAVAPPVRTRAEEACAVCGGAGEIAYSGLRDRLFGVSGEWTLRRCRDRACGLLWLDPMPIDEDLPRLYENYYTHSQAEASSRAAGIRELIRDSYWTVCYGDGRRADPRARVLAGFVRLSPGLPSELGQAIFELPLKRGGRLLEIGCGNGAAMRRMAELGWEVEGVDFDEKAVELARSSGLEVRLGSIDAQGYAADSFDAVVMSHVLEHVPDPRALLAECRRILKPGGRLVSITPNASSWGHKVFGRDWLHLDPPRHLHIFTPPSLRNLASTAGWRQVAVRSSMVNTLGMIRASRRLRSGGKFDMASSPSRAGDPGFRLFQAFAALLHRFSPDAGEELVLHATKDW
jgi:2-polyprenyl-3-methyl-5-hydroxy-6-metoxy-1,4-benzoquinol methylase